MAEESGPLPSKITGVIPFFFYDAVGRMVPGATLVFGTLLLVNHCVISTWTNDLHKVFPESYGAAYAAAVVLLFCGLIYFLGFLLASLAYSLVEWLANRLAPLDMAGMEEYLGTEGTTVLSTRFKTYFGDPLNVTLLERASFLCFYYVWKNDQNLGLMSARQDAELLGSRSLVLVSFFFSVAPLVVKVWHLLTSVPMQWDWQSSLWWLFVFVASLLTYVYNRKKKTYGRFAMFIALTSETKPSDKGC